MSRKKKVSAFVGMTLGNNIIYHIIDEEGEFQDTGLSIIHFLKSNKSKFLANMMASQAYSSINVILDDEFEFGDYMSHSNINVNTFSNVCSMIDSGNGPVEYYYIYDMYEDVLIVKTPDRDELVALDYKNSKDTRLFG